MATTLNGGIGADTLIALATDDYKLNGNAGNDHLTGLTRNDSLYGGDGDDFLDDNIGANSHMYGGLGNDTITSNLDPQFTSANSSFEGGGGLDTFLYADSDDVIIDLALGRVTDIAIPLSSATLISFEIAVGGGGDDSIVGAIASSLYGAGGNDNIYMGTGNGLGYGDAGNDTLTGGAGTNTLSGGADNDVIYGGAGSESINGDAGDDSIFGGAGNDIINTGTGTTSGDQVHAGDGADSIYGGFAVTAFDFYGEAGNDRFDSGTAFNAEDDYYGGLGIDTAVFTSSTYGGTFTIGSAGKAVINGVTIDLVAIENVTGSRFADSVIGNTAANLIYGGDGNDTLTGGTGTANDTLYGDGGDDALTDLFGVLSMFGGDGNDTFTLGDSIVGAAGTRITGGAGDLDEVIVSSSQNWTINLATGQILEGLDTHAITGIEAATGGNGNDTLVGDGGANNLTGGAGNDSVTGGNGIDTLKGGDGNDTVSGGGGDDLISQGSALDTDVLNGDVGSDTLTLTGSFGFSVQANGTAFAISGQSSFTYSGFEVLNGSAQDDYIEEGGTLDVISGMGGADVIVDNGTNGLGDIFDGGFGIDTLDLSNATSDRVLNLQTGVFSGNGGASNFENATGGIWNDALTGSTAANILIGAAGNDSLYGADAADSLYGGDGVDLVYGGTGADLLHGDIGNDTIYGDANNDLIYGDADLDTIYGGGNNDTIFGGLGNDFVAGGDAGDSLSGDAGADRLFGGNGGDTLTGGTEADTFVFKTSGEMGLGEQGDVITDFAIGSDKIDLSAIAGLVWIDTGAFTGVAGQVRQQVTGSTTVVSIDFDGNAVADVEISLTSVLGIGAGDLIL